VLTELETETDMRFRRSDLPGILIAGLAPVGLMLIFLASFETWHHEGTPLLGTMSANLAIGGGLLAALTRFIRNWNVPLASVLLMVTCAAAVVILQETGNDNTGANLLKWLGVLGFLVFNISVALQIVSYGLLPTLDRRAARLAAESES
jgi:4-amino-4-deoxy-L-arabinose transferase-like glycosyltransferase